MLKKYKWVFVASTYTLFIIIGSLSNLSNVPKVSFSNADKLVHAGCYGGCLLIWYVATLSLNTRTKLVILSLLVFLFGVVMELLQVLLTTHRQADWLDILANTSGILVVFILLKFFKLKEVLKTLI